MKTLTVLNAIVVAEMYINLSTMDRRVFYVINSEQLKARSNVLLEKLRDKSYIGQGHFPDHPLFYKHSVSIMASHHPQLAGHNQGPAIKGLAITGPACCASVQIVMLTNSHHSSGGKEAQP